MNIQYFLENVVKGISGLSILVALWGVVLVAKDFFYGEFKVHNRHDRIKKNTIIKNNLASYILLAFEILIAADVILSIIRPTLKDIGMLTILVIIRTFITYFLNQELKAYRERKKNNE